MPWSCGECSTSPTAAQGRFARAAICGLFATTTPFPPAALVELYGDQAGYGDAVEAAAAAVEDGFLLPPDADLIIGAARDTPIGE